MHATLRRLASRSYVPLLCLTILLGTSAVASACPSCQAALSGDKAAGDLARGIYYSVLFMLSMPFAIVGSFGFMAYRMVKQEQRRLAELEKEKERQLGLRQN